jgi:hypothetical protein
MRIQKTSVAGFTVVVLLAVVLFITTFRPAWYRPCILIYSYVPQHIAGWVLAAVIMGSWGYFCKLSRRRPGRERVSLAALPIAVFFAVTAAIALPNLNCRPLFRSSNACINNLRQLDGAAQQWGLEKHKTIGDRPTLEDVKPYIKLDSAGALPRCPQGGTYTLNPIGTTPSVTCSLSTLRVNPHIMP